MDFSAATSDYASITVDFDERVAQITLSRPERQNRFDDQLRLELTHVFCQLRDEPAVRAVVLASNGETFSAGGDFDFMAVLHDQPQARARLIDGARIMFDALLEVPQPVVVALQGAAVGAGANLALACDIVVASGNVRIADPHVRIGLVSGDGACVWWPQSIGLHRARRHLLTGDPIDAATAHEYGLVTDLVDGPEDVLPAARKIAAKIAALPPLAVRGNKRSLNHIAQIRVAEVLELSLALEEKTLTSSDLLEAIAAFKERRAGRYDGV